MSQYLAFRVLGLLAPIVPPSLAYWLCDRLGDIVYWLLPKRRATVSRNISRVVRGREVALEPMVRGTFREGTKYYYDTFRAAALSDAQLERLVHFDGLDILGNVLEQGRGAIILTAHFGSPSLVVQIIAMRGYKITTVVEPVKPQKLFDLLNGARGSRGIRLLPLGPSSFQDLSAALRRNEVVGLLADRDLQGTGVSVKLFGAETKLPIGPVMLSLRTGAPLLPTFGVRDENGKFRGYMEEPVPLERTGDLREDIRVNTQKAAEVLERAISKRPDQWIVFEPIWPEAGEVKMAPRR